MLKLISSFLFNDVFQIKFIIKLDLGIKKKWILKSKFDLFQYKLLSLSIITNTLSNRFDLVTLDPQ